MEAKVMGFWKTFFACLLAIIVGSIGSLIVGLILFAGIVSSVVSMDETTVKLNKQSLLMIDLSEPLVEVASGSLIENFDFDNFRPKSSTTIYQAAALIHAASQDPMIKGIYLKIPPTMALSLSSTYELREALMQFRTTSDKFIVAYGDVYSQGALYLSSAADKVYCNPAGGVEWQGLSSSVMFFKGTLNKLGIEPEIIRNGRFKGAVEPYMLSKMSPENREQTQALLGSTWDFVVDQIASSRSISADTLQLMASRMSIQTPSDAMRAGLIDSVMYRDQFIVSLEKLCGDDKFSTITLSDYRRSGVRINGDPLASDKVTIIYANGMIVDQATGSGQVVGNDLALALRTARKDDKVKAVVLRVNSPGGSAMASEVIRREVELTKKAKPVVISMGAYAASGGYWISCPSDAIVATPVTLTGSIGVFGLMFNVEKGAKEKLGLTFDVVNTNPMADIGMPYRSLSSGERRIIQNQVDTVYANFIRNVSSGRDMSAARVDSLGQGRVWSGVQAIQHDLVDSLGSINDAIKIAAQKAGLTSYRVVSTVTSSKSSFSSIFGSMARATFAWVVGGPQSATDAMSAKIEAIRTPGIKATMEYEIEIDK